MNPSESSDDLARKERERTFHNRVFADDSRADLGRFYSVAQPSYDRFRDLIVARAEGQVVLEYGCGPGTYAFQLARRAVRVVGIDISEVAIGIARERAAACRADNTEFHAMDAENLTFRDSTFDLVCGRSILHHLNLEKSFQAIARVLKPGGSALFLEPLGHNAAIRRYRSLTPAMRTEDEHPLLKRDFLLARRFFERVEVRPAVLAALACFPARSWRSFPRVLRGFELVDEVLLKLPWFRWQAWNSTWILEGPRR
jgi:ubiquinone/menaquinone biosynthesis C-methylase UbiE